MKKKRMSFPVEVSSGSVTVKIYRVRNLECRAYYELCWHLRGAQGNLAHRHAEDIDLLKAFYVQSQYSDKEQKTPQFLPQFLNADGDRGQESTPKDAMSFRCADSSPLLWVRRAK